MSTRIMTRKRMFTLAALLLLAAQAGVSHAQQFLIADRVNDNVYRYGQFGNVIGEVITDTTGLLDPTGLALSADYTKLFVASSGNNSLIKYDYNFAAGTASNPVVIADAAKGLALPNAVKFSPDGSTIYVANLNGGGVSQFNANGDVLGGPLFGSSIFAYSGLDYGPTGDLIVGGFSDNVGQGGVLKSSGPGLADLVAPTFSISGAAGVLVNGNDLYVSGLLAGTILRFNATTGAPDPGFGVSGLEYPQALLLNPDGSGFLAGILGPGDGEGFISRYDFNGSFLGKFAEPSANGFEEATAFISIIPEPTSAGLMAIAAVGLGFTRRRRVIGSQNATVV